MNKLLKHLTIYYLLSTINSLLLYAYPPGWSDDILINQDTSWVTSTPDIDVDSYNNVWVSWDSATWISGEIFYSKRDSLGNCLIPETTISNNPSKSWMARIAVDHANNVHFVWRDESPQGFGLWHAKLANDGSTLVPSHLAVSGAGTTSSSLVPEIAIDKYQNINVAWDEAPSGLNQIMYSKLDSLGNPVIEKIRITPENVCGYWLGMCVDSFANSHIGYRTWSSCLTYAKLDKDGNILISNETLGYTAASPTLVADRSQNINIVWPDPEGPGYTIKYLRLDQNGHIIAGPVYVSFDPSNDVPHMALDSLQYLHIVWSRNVNDPGDSFVINYAKVDTLGQIVIPAMPIVYYHPGGPRIAVDRSNRLHVVWVDQRLNPGNSTDIFYKRGENEPVGIGTQKSNQANLLKISVYPNPFIEMTRIKFQSALSGPNPNSQTTLKIYDASGRLVKSFLLPTSYFLFPTSVVWQGDDDSGHKLSAGVYFVQCKAKDFALFKKLIKLK